MNKIAVVTTKSFGDFVIAHAALHGLTTVAREHVRLIACNHVRELATILPAGVSVAFLPLEEDQVPPLFDIRKRGIRSALKSAMWLRRALDGLPKRPGEHLAFDSLGMRERFIAGRWPPLAVGRGRNIYEAYNRLFDGYGFSCVNEVTPVRAKLARTLGIFPESRLAEKTLNVAAISLIVTEAVRLGLHIRLMVLDGDSGPVPPDIDVQKVPRNFESLAQAIKSVDCVISADSLPAHLGEYLGKPVFVAAAFPNEYWLPRICFADVRWGLFRQPDRFRIALERFLTQLTG